MKKLLISAVCVLAALSAAAQGALNFNNKVSAIGLDAPVMDFNGVNLDSTYLAQLYFSAPGANSFSSVGDALPFRSGAGAGYFNTSGADTGRVIPGFASGATVDVRVHAWDGAFSTYEDAVAGMGAAGFSPTLSVTLGGGTVTPPNLVGLSSFQLSAGGTVGVPEPSTIALGLLGAGLLLFRRRK
jgi:hypothetical protein